MDGYGDNDGYDDDDCGGGDDDDDDGDDDDDDDDDDGGDDDDDDDDNVDGYGELAHGWRPPRGGKRAQRNSCP